MSIQIENLMRQEKEKYREQCGIEIEFDPVDPKQSFEGIGSIELSFHLKRVVDQQKYDAWKNGPQPEVIRSVVKQ